MQYVGQTKRKLKERFRKHFNKMKNLNKLILFSASISHELETHDLQIKLCYNHLFLIILKIKKHLLFVINMINLLEVQYSISINWLLILILILRLQIHEIVKIQNPVMNQQAILLQEI